VQELQQEAQQGQEALVFNLHKEHGRLGMQLGVLADLRVVMVTQVGCYRCATGVLPVCIASPPPVY
jgi:hypothetical protein